MSKGKRKHYVAFEVGRISASQVVVGLSATATRNTTVRPHKRRKVAPQVLALLSATPTFPSEPFSLKFGDVLPREGYLAEYKASNFQDRRHMWALFKEELPRNLVGFLNCASGTFSICFGIGDRGHVIGMWLTAEQKQRLPEETSTLIRSKVSRLVLQESDYSMSFLRVDPDSLPGIEGSRLYVIKFAVNAKNPTTEDEFYATRKALDSDPKENSIYLRAGCAQVAKLTKKEVADLVRSRKAALSASVSAPAKDPQPEDY